MSLQPMHSVDSTLGAMFLGVFASSALYGLTSFQMLVYIRNFEKDRIPLKLLVWAVWVLESLHVALTWHFIYIYLILHFSEAPQNLLATWSIDLTVVVTSLIVLLVDIFFVHRIYHLSNKNRILCAVVSFFVMARLALGLVITIRWFWLKPFDLFHLKIKDEMTASLALGVATDVLITASLCHYLQISRNGFQKTDNILNTLTIYAINNGLITSITDILILTFFLAYEKSLTYLALYQLLSKFYANSLLATLNSRPRQQQRFTENPLPLPTVTLGPLGPVSKGSSPGIPYFPSPKEATFTASDDGHSDNGLQLQHSDWTFRSEKPPLLE